MKNPNVIIYTDGGCKPNPGKGGIGAVLQFQSPARTEELYKFYPSTTSSRMEIQAAISALEFLSCPHDCVIYSDSSYLINGITSWIKSWKKKGWTRGKSSSVENVDLWQKLDALTQKHFIDWQWVKGHSGNTGNERADKLANLAINTQSNGNVAISSETSNLTHSKPKKSVFIVGDSRSEELKVFDNHDKADAHITAQGNFELFIRECEVL